ncbi:transporter substrate-binding domain-containing protein [Neobacillus cucumis]|nr:transporter substrate-binding domain-containing protein [Neobacillus cucumis]MCM3727417.1 transporter substrate-binding domain-containing protein [Neobacillus cucumis]
MAEAQDKDVIRVGFDKNLPPLSYLDQNGAAAGFDIELIRNVAAQQRVQIKLIPLELEDVVHKLKAGQLDVIVGMKYTSTVDTFLDFSDSYLTISDAVVVPAAIRDLSGINELKEKVVAVQREDTVITQLEGIRGSKMLVAFNQPDAMEMLFLGRADVFLGNRWTAEYILQKENKQLHYRIRTGLIPPSDYAFAVREGNYNLLNELNKGLAELHRNGTYERLYSQYLEPYNGMEIGWWRKLVSGLLIALGITVIVLAGSFFWNKRLQKEVKKQTAALADSFAFQTKVMDSVDNGILSFDQEGRITLINHVARNLLGIKDELGGTNVVDYLPQIPLDQTADLSEQRMLQGEFHLRDGTDRILHYYLASLQNSAGEQAGGILSLQNRTEQKHLQARLIAQEKMRALGQLVAGIAHELRNPLTAIKTFAELLPLKLDDSRFRAELVRHVPEEVERMNRIIEDLLDYSREKPMHRKWANLQDLIQSVTSLFRKQIRSEGIKLEVDISPDLEVYVDRDRIKQVLINLILNAIEAMSATIDKKLTFHAKTDRQLICLVITDLGAGIEERDIVHLFQPFYTSKSQGIGLGLYISQKIMLEHGGRIEVKSVKNKGTTFILYFSNEGDAS